MKSTYSPFLSQSALRVVVSFVGIIVCLFCIWIAGRAGFSVVLGKYALLAGDLAAADKAVGLTAADADAHMIRATLLYQMNRVPDAAREMELAVSLRPHDHSLWLQLASIRDELHDSAGALPAFNEAVRLAPFYAYPTWQRGNFLLRMGRYADAFADLRRAAASNPDYVPVLIDLAWAISKGDVPLTEQLAAITTSELRVAFAQLLAKQGRSKEAAEQIALAGKLRDQTRRDLAQLLIAKNAFKEAFEVWKKTADFGSGEPKPAAIQNAGFEGPIAFNEMDFGWRVPRALQGVRLAADSSQSHSGSRSLLVEFLGDSNPDLPLLSQLILVEPSRNYRVSFAARAQDIVTGGLPFAVVRDAAGTDKQLSESATVRQEIADWQTMSLDFQTESTTSAILLSVQRKNCAQWPCPIFGSLWLDSFSLEEMK